MNTFFNIERWKKINIDRFYILNTFLKFFNGFTFDQKYEKFFFSKAKNKDKRTKKIEKMFYIEPIIWHWKIQMIIKKNTTEFFYFWFQIWNQHEKLNKKKITLFYYIYIKRSFMKLIDQIEENIFVWVPLKNTQ